MTPSPAIAITAKVARTHSTGTFRCSAMPLATPPTIEPSGRRVSLGMPSGVNRPAAGGVSPGLAAAPGVAPDSVAVGPVLAVQALPAAGAVGAAPAVITGI